MTLPPIPAAERTETSISYRSHSSPLLREVLDESAKAGKPITIHVEAYNPALRLYERLGFRSIDTNGVYYLMEWRHR